MNHNLCHIHSNLLPINGRRTTFKMVSSKRQSQLIGLTTNDIKNFYSWSWIFSYLCTQWAAVMTMRGSQLRRRAPHPSQELSDLRMATCSGWVLHWSMIWHGENTCHGISFSRATSPPTTLNGSLPFFTILGFVSFCFFFNLLVSDHPLLPQFTALASLWVLKKHW